MDRYSVCLSYKIIPAVVLITVGVLSWHCSSPRYRSDVRVAADQQLTFEKGMDLEALIFERLEKASRGLEVQVRISDLEAAYRPLQKWIAEIKDAGSEFTDQKKLLEKYPILTREGAPDELSRLRNRIADKTEDIFNTRSKNRRTFLARRYNLVLDEHNDVLVFVFLARRQTKEQ